jgi:hypothetical protein
MSRKTVTTKEITILLRTLGLTVCIALMVGSPARAQKYPERVISIIVPFTAGGPTDTVARLIAQPMSKLLKQQVIIEMSVAPVAPSARRAWPVQLRTATHCSYITLGIRPRQVFIPSSLMIRSETSSPSASSMKCP